MWQLKHPNLSLPTPLFLKYINVIPVTKVNEDKPYRVIPFATGGRSLLLYRCMFFLYVPPVAGFGCEIPEIVLPTQ